MIRLIACPNYSLNWTSKLDFLMKRLVTCRVEISDSRSHLLALEEIPPRILRVSEQSRKETRGRLRPTDIYADVMLIFWVMPSCRVSTPARSHASARLLPLCRVFSPYGSRRTAAARDLWFKD